MREPSLVQTLIWCAPCKVEGMTKRTCIVVADRARARFFMVEAVAPEHRSTRGTERLTEIEALVEPEGETTGKKCEEQRERHREEVERRFAKRIAQALGEFALRQRVERVVLGAEPHMLGLLRPRVTESLPPGTELLELAEELSWHNPDHVQRALSRRGAGLRRRSS